MGMQTKTKKCFFSEHQLILGVITAHRHNFSTSLKDKMENCPLFQEGY